MGGWRYLWRVFESGAGCLRDLAMELLGEMVGGGWVSDGTGPMR